MSSALRAQLRRRLRRELEPAFEEFLDALAEAIDRRTAAAVSEVGRDVALGLANARRPLTEEVTHAEPEVSARDRGGARAGRRVRSTAAVVAGDAGRPLAEALDVVRDRRAGDADGETDGAGSGAGDAVTATIAHATGRWGQAQRCRICRQTGHNARRCADAAGQRSNESTPAAARSAGPPPPASATPPPPPASTLDDEGQEEQEVQEVRPEPRGGRVVDRFALIEAQAAARRAGASRGGGQ